MTASLPDATKLPVSAGAAITTTGHAQTRPEPAIAISAYVATTAETRPAAATEAKTGMETAAAT